jgi:acetoacetate decarboxylase
LALRGRLTLDRLGYSMPTDAPAFQAPPYHYRNAQAISIKFETDPESALDVLPAPLELIEPAAANLSFYWYPFTTFGPYHEAILRLYARHEGKPLTYIAQIFVDTEPPMLAGREVWGYPKKLAKIGFERDKDMVVGWLERPQGVRLATAIMRPEQPAGALSSNGPTTGLRIVPSASPPTNGLRSPNSSPPTLSTRFGRPGRDPARSRFPTTQCSTRSTVFRSSAS